MPYDNARKRKLRARWEKALQDEALRRIESALLFEAVFGRRYIPNMLETATIADAIRKLTVRQREVLALRFGGPELMPVKDVGEAAGITRERARQLIEQSLIALRSAVELQAEEGEQ